MKQEQTPLTDMLHVYHVTKTITYKNSDASTKQYFAVAPIGLIEKIGPAEFEIPGTVRFEKMAELANELAKRNDPPQSYKLPRGMPARSSHLYKDTGFVEYMRRGVHPRERDELCRLISEEMIKKI